MFKISYKFDFCFHLIIGVSLYITHIYLFIVHSTVSWLSLFIFNQKKQQIAPPLMIRKRKLITSNFP